jgi:hypothetical protein
MSMMLKVYTMFVVPLPWPALCPLNHKENNGRFLSAGPNRLSPWLKSSP